MKKEKLITRFLIAGLMSGRLQKTALVAYILLITLLSLLPGSDLPKVKLFLHADKVVHLCMYAGLTFLLFWAWPRFFRGSRQWLPLVAVMYWGLSMEILQDLSPYGREFDLYDMAANTLGFFPGWLIWRWLNRWFSNFPMLAPSQH